VVTGGGPSDSGAAATERLGWVREEAGPQFPDLELQRYVQAIEVTHDRTGAAERIGVQLGQGVVDVLRSPHVLAGTVPQICDDLRSRREEYGASYLGISTDQLAAFTPVVAELAGT
jgi:hypothetical protein